jgi:hypothetical protein
VSLQERPVDESVGPKRDEMHQRAAVLVDSGHKVTDEDRKAAAKYIRRWAVKTKADNWQDVLDALGLM